MQSKKINELGTNVSPSVNDLTVIGDASTGQLKKITLQQIAGLFGASGTVSSIATTSPLTGGTITTSGTLGITQATTSTNGYLSSTDWNTFNNKVSTSSLSSYVPYTGATGNLNLGAYKLTTSSPIIDNISGGGCLNFKMYNASDDYALNNNDYFSFYPLSGYYAIFSFNNAGVKKRFIFHTGNLAADTPRYYGMPNADGTFALTTDISSSLTSYVPYTGATANVNLGTNYNLSSKYLFANGDNSGSGLSGVVSLRIGSSIVNASGYGTIGAATGQQFVFCSALTGSYNKIAYLNLSGLTDSAARVYSLPDVTGTLALTSNLSSYVPYTGATSQLDMGANNILVGTNLGTNGIRVICSTGYGVTSEAAGCKLLLDPQSLILTDKQFSNFTKTLIFRAGGLSANYTLTLPDATGTVALTSDISSTLGSYVPYTGATSSLNLGTNGITALSLYLKKSGTIGAAIIWDTVTGLSIGGSGQTSIGPSGTDSFAFYFGSSTKAFFFNAANITAQRIFTLPDTSGTIALVGGSGVGTVTSVGGTGTVSGLTLTGTVTSSGSLTLGGTLSLTSANITGGLGYTPYNSSNPSGYVTSSGSVNYANTAGYLTGPAATNGSDGWFRSSGATGWYNSTYTGGIYCTDSSYVRTYNSFALYVGNTILATGDITAYYSDERLKEKQGKIVNATMKIKSLDAFYYKNNDLAKSFGYTSDKMQVGLSAQQVKMIMPELVKRAPFDVAVNEDKTEYSKSGEEYMTIDYGKLTPLIIAGFQEQQKTIELQQEKIELQQEQIEYLYEKIKHLIKE
ncbi:Intramolecular chaperone auto-processing domain containing protein [uncultured Caudovirales phage]|uniref:Intramolecular chaperone auto-processing domain containing protein n=1 Tax=uncultured Caudovirales phage TaxID=2100421 RepID=A0A6J5KI71_9CAUD|nr:Intramolecular chaperone auto-processing domain containing protein [uncultured Caudovirales phage]